MTNKLYDDSVERREREDAYDLSPCAIIIMAAAADFRQPDVIMCNDIKSTA